MKSRPLTDDQKIRIEELREDRGWSHERIAKDIGVSTGAVSWHCLINAIEDRTGDPQPVRKINSPETYLRRGFIVRAYSAEDDRNLVAWEKAGVSYAEMGRRLGRKHNSIKGRLCTLARRAEREIEYQEFLSGAAA